MKEQSLLEKGMFVFGAICVLITAIIAINYKFDSSTDYEKVTKLGDGLYSVVFDKYLDNYETVKNYLNEKYYGEDANCTTFYKDGMLMRNLDWYINSGNNNTGELVVKTTASEGRYATIGVAYNPLVTDSTYNTLTDTEKAILPFILTDGMNSEGLMYGQNVVPEIDEISDTFGTNPDGEKINFYMLGRQLLDNCATVDEAIEYIKKVNIFMPMQDTGYRMESHIMLADKNRAVVIEFIDNKVVVLEQNQLLDNLPIMTNHYLYNGGENTGHGMGYQRDAIVKSMYNDITDWQSGMKTLKAVKYTNSYALPLGDTFWYSEYYTKYVSEDGTVYDFNKDTKNDDPDFLTYINLEKAKYEKLDGECWWTNHSSVYDSNTKTLHLAVHENYENIYEFKISN